ncbi:hypothetical protein D6C87_02471 [Aureobasidium pullulans]|uniref:Tetraspanin n=1 Tax=Aureobasidium pullulans TaxID=5580 RepID=A0AB38LT17_AURPU|nr:hypothetical protein D6C94_06580 [Aureobasidium pullulans]THZ45988.1 hypothetical protein D6C87_02471 [Aureobasidium pullulans]
MALLTLFSSMRMPEPCGWSAAVKKTIYLSLVMLILIGLIGTMIWASLYLHKTIIVISLLVGIVCISMLLGALVLTTINLHLKQEHDYERQDSPDLLLIHPAFRNDFRDHLSKGGIPRNFSIPRERCIDNKERTSPTLPKPASLAFVATGMSIKYEKKPAVGCRPLPTLPTTTKAVEAGEARSTVDHPLPPIPTVPTSPTIDIQEVDTELQTPEKSTHSLAPIIELQEATPTPEGHRHLIIDALPINRLTWTKSTTIRKASDKLDVPVMDKRGRSSEY